MERNLQYYEEATDNGWGGGGYARNVLPPPPFFCNKSKLKGGGGKRKCIPNINIERYFTVCGAIYRSITLLSATNILKCKDASKFSNSPTKEKLLVQTWE
jgi:hypothetical protein